jgi:hypothetical protein
MCLSDVNLDHPSLPSTKICTWKSPKFSGLMCFLFGSLGLLYVGVIPFVIGFICECLCIVPLISGVVSSPYSPLLLIILYRIIYFYIGWLCAIKYNRQHGLENPYKPCRKCGYNLKGVEGTICPLCGDPIT